MNEGKVGILKDTDILRLALRRKGLTQLRLAEKLGITPHAVSANMTRNKIGLGTFAKLLDVMGYDVYIVDRETGDALWCVEVPENPEK